MRYAVALVAALILNATANLLIKASAMGSVGQVGSDSAGPLGAFKALLANVPFLVGLICFGLNLVAYQYALQKLQISIAYPIMVTCGYVIIVIVAGMKMGERLAAVQWAGVALILLGVWLVSAYVRPTPTPAGPAAQTPQPAASQTQR